MTNAYGTSAIFLDSSQETISEANEAYTEAQANYEVAVLANENWDESTIYEYASQTEVRADLSDYVWATAFGNYIMYDNPFDRELDLQDDLGLSGGDAFSMTWNQIETQAFNVTNNVENIATNYAIAAQLDYTGPANTNVANLALQSAQNLGVLDYDYQEAQAGHYFQQGASNVGATITDWAVTAGTYTALVIESAATAHATTTDIDLTDIAEQAQEAGDVAAVVVRQDDMENLVEQHNQNAETEADKIDLDQYISFQTDEEIVRSRQELNWETVEKVVAPVAAVIVLPIAVASGAGIGVVAGVASSTFSLYQGAGIKAQALELEKVVISEGIDNRKNAQVLATLGAQGITYKDPSYDTAYQETMVAVEEQVEMLNKQGNIMIASSAVAGLTSGAGIINGFNAGAQAAIAAGGTVARSTQIAMNVSQTMSTVGRVGGIGLSSYNAINSGQQAVAAANILSGIDALVASGTMTEAEAAAKKSELKGQVAMSGLSSFVAASGVVGNTFGFIRNPSLQTQAITTKTDLILDIMNVPAGVAVDAQNVSQSCFNSSYPSGEDDCRDAWIGLALSITQDVAQVRNSTSSFKNYQNEQLTNLSLAGDYAQRISLLDQRMLGLVENDSRSMAANLELLDLRSYRQQLSLEASRLNAGLVIPELAKINNITSVDTQKITDVSRQNYESLVQRANEVKASNGELATRLVRQAEDSWNHQQDVLRIYGEVADIDRQISQESSRMSDLEIESLRGKRGGLVDDLESRINNQPFKTANLDQDNLQLLASTRVSEALETYDNARLAEDQAVNLERLNLPPPDDDSPKKRTGLALLIPGSAEQNKALDLATLQTRLHEIDSLNTQKTQIEQDLEIYRQIDADDPLVRSLETELASIDQKIVDANKVVDQVTPSDIGGEPSFWQRLTAILPSQKTAQSYDRAMLAASEMSSIRQERATIAQEISRLADQSSLSASDKLRASDLSVRLEVIDQRYAEAEGLVKGISDRAQIALDPQTSRIAAFFSGSLESLSKILPSRNQSAGSAQQDFDTKYQVTEENIVQQAEAVAAIKDQLATAKNSYNELTGNQNKVKKYNSEITRLNQELADLERQTESFSEEQVARKDEILSRVVEVEDAKRIISNSINRLEDQLLQPILSVDVAQKLTQAQQDGDFDEVLGMIRTDELSRLAQNKIGLSSRQDSIIEDLLKIKSSMVNSSSAEDLVLQRDLYNQKLSELNESILGSSPEAADYQRLSSAQQFLKNMDVLTAARSARAVGDDDGAISILSSKEASVPVEDSALAARLETIIHDVEFRAGASEGIEFFNSRSNQMDTYLKILQGERVAIELTTAGGKTFVGSILLKTQVEILGYDTGIYIAKPGQEADIQRSMMKSYGVGEEKVIILDSSRLSEPEYISSLLASRFVVADPSNLQFIRNSANNFDDPNFKTANDVYKKLTENTSLYIDELQINLDPSRQAINSVGASSEDIPDAYKNSARLVGEALDETLLKNGGWGLGDNDFLVLRTSEGAEVAKFSQSAQKDIFTALAKKMGVSAADYDLVKNNAPELERALGQDVEILKQKLATLGVKLSPSDAEKIFDQIDMVNTFAQGLKMRNGTDYQRMRDSVLANNGGLERPVTVPAAGAVANEGQSYAAKLQVAMEYIGARANNEIPNFKGLTSSPSLAYKSTIADYLGDLRGSSVGAVTGALADGRGVAETALGLVTYRSTEAVEKILSIEGSSTGERINVDRSYQINRDGDVDALVALKLAGKLNQSTGEDARGNLKIVMGFDGAKNPLDFAVEMAKSRAFDQAEFAVQNADGSYSLIKIDSSGETVSSRDININAIQDLYNDKNNPAQNLITIIGRGGATGDSIKTARNIPGVTITSFDAPEGLVAQAGARIDRGSDIADQYALIINRNTTRLNIDNPVDFLRISQMTESDFTAFRNQVTEVQKTVEQAKNTQALDQGVVASSTRVLSDLIRNSTVPEIQKWASNKLLDFYAEETQRDLSLDGGSQESLLARQKKISVQVDSWERLLTDKSNINILDTIKKLHPELYDQMRSNVNANDQKLAYAETESGSKESVMTAANLSEFVDRHNKYVAADSENKYVADSGRSPMVDQIATNTQRNSVAANKARARITQVVDLVKGLRNVSINISNPLKAIPGLIDRAKTSQLSKNLIKLPKNLPSWIPDIKEVKKNGQLQYEKRLADLKALNEKLANTKDRIAQADIVERIKQAKTALGESKFATRVSVFLKDRSKLAEQNESDVQEQGVENGEGTLVGDIGFALGKAWSRRSDKTGKSTTDEKTLVNDIGFSLAKAWNKRKNRIDEVKTETKVETKSIAKVNSDGRTRTEAFGFALGRAVTTRMIPGISVIGDRLAILFKENPELIDRKEQIITDLKIVDPKILANINSLKSVESLEVFITTREVAYQQLKDQFKAIGTTFKVINDEEVFAAEENRLLGILAEISTLEEESGISFIKTSDEGEELIIVRIDGSKNLSTFKAEAEREIERLAAEDVGIEETGEIPGLEIRDLTSLETEEFKNWINGSKLDEEMIEAARIESENWFKVNGYYFSILENFSKNKQWKAFGEDYLPTKSLKIDGNEWLLAEKNSRVGGSSSVLMYAKVGNKFIPRIFYKSISGGIWRGSPGIDGGFSYKEALEDDVHGHYVQTGQLDPRLNSFLSKEFDQFEIINTDNYSTLFRPSFAISMGWYSFGEEIETKLFDELSNITKYAPGSLTERLHGEISNEELEKLSFPDEFIPDFTQNPEFSYQESHNYLGDVTYEIYGGATFREEEIKWLVAKDSEGRVWISNIYFANGDISTYGTSKTVIDAGILTSKPLDYENQIDALDQNFISPKGNYGDITPILDHLKPIRDYRKAKGVVRTGSAAYKGYKENQVAEQQNDLKALAIDFPLELGEEELAEEIEQSAPAISLDKVEQFLNQLEMIGGSEVASLSLGSLSESLSRINRIVEELENNQLDGGIITKFRAIALIFKETEQEYVALLSQVKNLIGTLNLKNIRISTTLKSLRDQKTTLEDYLNKERDKIEIPLELVNWKGGEEFVQKDFEWSKISRRDVRQFNVLISSQIDIVKKLFSSKENGAYYPKYVANMGGKKAYFTGPIQRQRNKRKFMVFYIEGENGKLYPRILYKSQSQGSWRATPGAIRNKKTNKLLYAKGRNKNLYAVETQLSPPFLDLVEQIEVENNSRYVSYDPIDEHFNAEELSKNRINTYENEAPQEVKISSQIAEYLPGKLTSEFLSPAKIEDIEKNISGMEDVINFMPDFSGDPVMVRKNQHEFLGEVTYETYQRFATIDGEERPLNWEMARTVDGKVWINNIYLADSKVISYGNLQEVINSGILTLKPLDYSDQVTAVPNHLKKEVLGSSYQDITSLIDLLLPIKDYRMVKGFYPNRVSQGHNNSVWKLFGRNNLASVVADKNLLGQISTRHLMIKVGPDGQILLKDLESTNGTFINGQKIKTNEWFAIDHSDVITLGDNVFSFKASLKEKGLSLKKFSLEKEKQAEQQELILDLNRNFEEAVLDPELFKLLEISGKEAVESLADTTSSSNDSFKDLCSSCAEVRDQTQEGVQQVDALINENITKQELARANRELAQNSSLEGGQNKVKELEAAAKNLDQEAEKLRKQALALIDRTRKEVVNEHGMQNQCVQLYLNAWVDTREAEIRQNNSDTNKAIASVYRATVIAEELLSTNEMEVVDRQGFLGIGRKAEVLGLVSEDLTDIENMLDGNDDIPGLRQMAEFERDEQGKLNRRRTVGGSLHGLKKSVTKGYIFDAGDQLRIWGRSFNTVWRQKFGKEVGVDDSFKNFNISSGLSNQILNLFEKYKGSYSNIIRKAEYLANQDKYLDDFGYVHFNQATDLGCSVSFGECSDISFSLFSDLQKSGLVEELADLDLEVSIARGQEPQFFSQKHNNHIFLTVSKKSEQNSDKQYLILDPSLQKVGEATQLGYQINGNISDRELNTYRYIEIINREEGVNDAEVTGNKILLGVTKDLEYITSFHYEENDEGIYPVLSFLDQDGGRQQFVLEKQELISRIKTGVDISETNLGLAQQILTQLQNPKFIEVVLPSISDPDQNLYAPDGTIIGDDMSLVEEEDTGEVDEKDDSSELTQNDGLEEVASKKSSSLSVIDRIKSSASRFANFISGLFSREQRQLQSGSMQFVISEGEQVILKEGDLIGGISIPAVGEAVSYEIDYGSDYNPKGQYNGEIKLDKYGIKTKKITLIFKDASYDGNEILRIEIIPEETLIARDVGGDFNFVQKTALFAQSLLRTGRVAQLFFNKISRSIIINKLEKSESVRELINISDENARSAILSFVPEWYSGEERESFYSEVVEVHNIGYRIKKALGEIGPDRYHQREFEERDVEIRRNYKVRLQELSEDGDGLQHVEYTLDDSDVDNVIELASLVSSHMWLPNSGNFSSDAELIAAIESSYKDPSTEIGRAQRTLVAILNTTDGYGVGPLSKILDVFLKESKGDIEDLPQVLANLLAYNLAHYRAYQDFWKPVLDTYNNEVLSTIRDLFGEGALNFGELSPSTIVWLTSNDQDYNGRSCSGVCTIETPIQDKNNAYIAIGVEGPLAVVNFEKVVESGVKINKIIDGKKASKAKTKSIHTLIHEGIHEQVLHKIGIYGALPTDSMTIGILEELTERLAITIHTELNKRHPEIDGENQVPREYLQHVSIGLGITKAFNFDDEVTLQFALDQDPVGYIQFMDEHLESLSDDEYVNFINNLLNDGQILPSQHRHLEENRTNKIIDIRQIIYSWRGIFGLSGGYYSGSSYLFKAIEGEIFPIEISGVDKNNVRDFSTVDLLRIVEQGNIDMLQDLEFIPEIPYSQTKAGKNISNFKPRSTSWN